MSTQIERRWGILAIAVLMFFVTMVVTNINGAKTSFYYYIWMMVGYYAYKANLSSIQSMMKIVIFINIGVLALIISFMDDTALGYLNSSSKLDLIASVILMLIPKVGLYFYCKSQLVRSYDFNKNSNTVAEEGSNKHGDDHWERAFKEVNGGERVAATWARAFSEADGDENKAKARYMKLRVENLVAVSDGISSKPLVERPPENSPARKPRRHRPKIPYEWTKLFVIFCAIVFVNWLGYWIKSL